MTNIHQTMQQLSITAGGPGSGRKPGFNGINWKDGMGTKHGGDLRRLKDLHGENMQDAAEEEDKEDRSLYHSDAKDIHKLAQHLSNGNYKKAAAHLDRMDTAPRDEAIGRLSDRTAKKVGYGDDW